VFGTHCLIGGRPEYRPTPQQSSTLMTCTERCTGSDFRHYVTSVIDVHIVRVYRVLDQGSMEHVGIGSVQKRRYSCCRGTPDRTYRVPVVRLDWRVLPAPTNDRPLSPRGLSCDTAKQLYLSRMSGRARGENCYTSAFAKYLFEPHGLSNGHLLGDYHHSGLRSDASIARRCFSIVLSLVSWPMLIMIAAVSNHPLSHEGHTSRTYARRTASLGVRQE
jgi:hypothetical protein